MVTDTSFWAGKRVLLTGHTGFKGGWLALWLAQKGAIVTGVALAPGPNPNLFMLADVEHAVESHICDIREHMRLDRIVRDAKPEIVLHLAAQPLVRASYKTPIYTFDTNVMGTAHVLDALRDLPDVRVALMITTDKVYRNNEWPHPYREDDALGGHDPYSASKAACEIVISSYRDSFLKAQGVAVATARAGNVIGGGDWSLDRLIPDAVRAWSSGQTLHIRRPQSTRPWQHVLEPLFGYMSLAEALWHKPELAGAFNFGPLPHEAATVRTVIDLARKVWGGGAVEYGDGTEGPHEAGWLALDIAKARSVLGVTPRWGIEESVKRTIEWYRAIGAGENARARCLAEIAEFEAALKDTPR
ncbi:MAG: CDP-glucose 4,6-dehydratase [Proteobacteria bacterium]|nr:CDP-glucose 4,6-dehydratase [Pseudomonadota bacterium]